VVTGEAIRAKTPGAFYGVRCECGREAVVRGHDLRLGLSTRCRSCAMVAKHAANPGQKAAWVRATVRNRAGRGASLESHFLRLEGEDLL